MEKQKVLKNGILMDAIHRAWDKDPELREYATGKEINEAELYQKARNYFKEPYIDLSNISVSKETLELMPEAVALTHQAVVFQCDAKGVCIAMLDPDNQDTIAFLKKRTQKQIQPYITDPKSLETVLSQYHESEYATPAMHHAMRYTQADKEKRFQGSLEIINGILAHAIAKDASEIIMEPDQQELRILFRVDGRLQTFTSIEHRLRSAVIGAVKWLGRMNVEMHNKKQQGFFNIQRKNETMEAHTVSVPVFHGEKIIIRLLDKNMDDLVFEKLGMDETQMETVKECLSDKEGFMLVTGPQDSGKKTTIYTILQYMNDGTRNIATLEDTIGRKMPSVNQTQIMPEYGLTFEKGAQAILEQDPDVIMIGKISNKKVAEISTHAAMMKRLVLSTLYAKDSVHALKEWRSFDLPPYIFAATAKAIISQRLVRKLCAYCKTEYMPDKKIQKIFKKQNTTFPKNITLYKQKGCESCEYTGYKGRTGIFEILKMTHAIQKAFIANAKEFELRKIALKEGLIPLSRAGLAKVADGVTSMEELARILPLT